MSQRTHLDYNATIPLSQLVKAELVRLLELSRLRVASLIG